MKTRPSTRPSCDDGPTWRVVDDLAHDYLIAAAELDAVEAFLMPLVHALLAERSDSEPGKTTSNLTSLPLPTHKRRNELLPEEI
jgi:hypothetical protein